MRIAVLGAGSWGSALAMQLARSGNSTVLWGRSASQLQAMSVSGCNDSFLPGIPFPIGVMFEASLEKAIGLSDEILIAVPSGAFVGVLEQVRPFLNEGQGISWACKGLEPGGGQFLHKAARERVGMGHPLAVVTGPSFAIEVARDLPTAVTVAGTEDEYCKKIAHALHGGNFRAYTSGDIVGAELGGAVKNVLAVATGIARIFLTDGPVSANITLGDTYFENQVGVSRDASGNYDVGFTGRIGNVESAANTQGVTQTTSGLFDSSQETENWGDAL